MEQHSKITWRIAKFKVPKMLITLLSSMYSFDIKDYLMFMFAMNINRSNDRQTLINQLEDLYQKNVIDTFKHKVMVEEMKTFDIDIIQQNIFEDCFSEEIVHNLLTSNDIQMDLIKEMKVTKTRTSRVKELLEIVETIEFTKPTSRTYVLTNVLKMITEIIDGRFNYITDDNFKNEMLFSLADGSINVDVFIAVARNILINEYRFNHFVD